MSNNCTLISNPQKDSLVLIKTWLINEDNKTGQGFYCNWDNIASAFDKNKLITFNVDDKPIGFLVWYSNQLCIHMDIFEIDPAYRKKGFGGLFFSMIEKHFNQMGYIVLELYCAPAQSEPFWQKMGFIKSPELDYREHDLTYFKPLIKTQVSCISQIPFNTIEVWDIDPNKANDNPRWVWSYDKNSHLQLPIIQRVGPDFKIRMWVNGVVAKNDKIKYFVDSVKCKDTEPYLYIKSNIE